RARHSPVAPAAHGAHLVRGGRALRLRGARVHAGCVRAGAHDSARRRQPAGAAPHLRNTRRSADPLYASRQHRAHERRHRVARPLGVTRSAIWKATGSLRELGATLHAVRNRGYRLAGAGEALDAAKIREHLAQDVRHHVRSLEATWSTASTNSVLLERANPPSALSEVFLAEYQTAGRGRRGRAWQASPGGAICLSLSWTFREVPRDLGALSLVIGVCALRALRELGVVGAGLKWPNDLLLGERKLGGVLIELRAESAGPACVVIGI